MGIDSLKMRILIIIKRKALKPNHIMFGIVEN